MIKLDLLAISENHSTIREMLNLWILIPHHLKPCFGADSSRVAARRSRSRADLSGGAGSGWGGPGGGGWMYRHWAGRSPACRLDGISGAYHGWIVGRRERSPSTPDCRGAALVANGPQVSLPRVGGVTGATGDDAAGGRRPGQDTRANPGAPPTDRVA